jgi:hypothetical protein
MAKKITGFLKNNQLKKIEGGGESYGEGIVRLGFWSLLKI